MAPLPSSRAGMPCVSGSATRIETDSLGEVTVPADRYWGAQTERSRQNFPIGNERMPIEIIRALARIKKACALANSECAGLAVEKARAISEVCDEIIAGELDEEFPLSVWQTGSGTHTNMNLNEVIANRAHVRAGGSLADGKRTLHPNDDVNRSQSSNDVFPSAMNLAAHELLRQRTLAQLSGLADALDERARASWSIVKIGRTHLMDATPLRLGQELAGHAHQLREGLGRLDAAAGRLCELALGGTAVGTGLNAPAGFAERAVELLRQHTGHPYQVTRNHFAAQASHDDLVAVAGALRTLAVSLTKIGGDLRLLASGPRAGLSELRLEAREPGSSIMPGKVNPTQIEALLMVCAQVMGNDVAVGVAGAGGQLELNACKPVIAFNVLMAARNLGDACESFAERCVRGLQPDREGIDRHLSRSLMLVTALAPRFGYDHAAEIAHKAHREGTTLRQAALSLGRVSADDFDALCDPRKMLGPSDSR